MTKIDELPDLEGWHLKNRQRKVRFDEANARAFLSLAWRDLAHDWDFDVVVSNDRAVRMANHRYRNVARTTDVLAFPATDDSPYESCAGHIGGIIISASMAAKQAEQYGHSVTDEIKILMLHGLLHLIGFDHEQDGGDMREFETVLRRKYGLPAGLIERQDQ